MWIYCRVCTGQFQDIWIDEEKILDVDVFLARSIHPTSSWNWNLGETLSFLIINFFGRVYMERLQSLYQISGVISPSKSSKSRFGTPATWRDFAFRKRGPFIAKTSLILYDIVSLHKKLKWLSISTKVPITKFRKPWIPTRATLTPKPNVKFNNTPKLRKMTSFLNKKVYSENKIELSLEIIFRLPARVLMKVQIYYLHKFFEWLIWLVLWW